MCQGRRMGICRPLTLKVPITTAADDNFFLFFFIFFFVCQRKQDLVLTFHAWQTIHMKCQDLLSLKNKKKILNVVCFKFCLAL